ncbi:MAG: hypothetical protein M3010_02130, partial [Candidatus Dormibacteraeota bacterium]|nr:hypothetical protein [Candidatus Dormibacteraeota bacterium]
MFRSVAARALLGVGIFGVAGGTTALAASPSGSAAAVGAAQAAKKPHRANIARGVIIARSDSEITVERAVRDKATKKVSKDDTRFAITPATKVFKSGSKDPLGHDALKV